MILQKILDNKWFTFAEGFDSWEDAITKAVEPLVDTGAVEPTYINSIVQCVKENGPYIVIAPDICIPHSNAPDRVNKTCMGFMRTEHPVDFGPGAEWKARLFFTLADVDEEEHLQNLRSLMKTLAEEENIQKLLEVKNEDDLRRTVNEIAEMANRS